MSKVLAIHLRLAELRERARLPGADLGLIEHERAVVRSDIRRLTDADFQDAEFGALRGYRPPPPRWSVRVPAVLCLLTFAAFVWLLAESV